MPELEKLVMFLLGEESVKILRPPVTPIPFGYFELLDDERFGLIWANFNDFDTLYGHRNDTIGFQKALESWDAQLKNFSLDYVLMTY